MYIKAKKLILDDVIPYINQDRCKAASLNIWCYNIGKEVKVSLGSTRIRLIGRTQHCAACLIKGNHFWIESNFKHLIENPDNWHLNLYAINHHGNPVMMTLDHIKPKSKGGTRASNNIQLLCENCNRIKSNETLANCEKES